MPIITTNRLVLSAVQQTDADWFCDLLAHPEVMRFSVKGPLTQEEALEVMRRDAVMTYQERGFALFACRLKENMHPMGYCGLSIKLIDDEEVPELGYRLFPEHWRKGYATEAIHAVKEYAFSELHLPKIVSIIEPLNTASIRVAQKNGILYEKSTLYKGVNVGIFTAYRKPHP